MKKYGCQFAAGGLISVLLNHSQLKCDCQKSNRIAFAHTSLLHMQGHSEKLSKTAKQIKAGKLPRSPIALGVSRLSLHGIYGIHSNSVFDIFA
ncbi:MAG: hypothetical protein AAFY33_06455 [Cyanobacteria bacterium J06643_4]